MMTSKTETAAAHPPLSKAKLKKISAGFLVHSAGLSLKKQFSQAISAAGYQISTEQYALLSQLWDEDGLFQSELGRRAFKDRHNVSRIIKSLEQKELVTKQADASDARLARCLLTQEGRALQGPLDRIRDRVLKTAFQGMADERIQALKRDLVHLLYNLGEDPF